MTENQKTAYGCLILLAAVPGLMWNAWCIATLWGWFVVPVFGIAVPSLKTIIGVDLIASLFVAQYTGPLETEEQAKSKLSRIVFGPAIVLGLGWLAKTWL